MRSCCVQTNTASYETYTASTTALAGPDWLIGSTGRSPGGDGLFFCLLFILRSPTVFSQCSLQVNDDTLSFDSLAPPPTATLCSK